MRIKLTYKDITRTVDFNGSINRGYTVSIKKVKRAITEIGKEIRRKNYD